MSAFHAVYTSMYDHNFAGMSTEAQVLEFYLRTCPQRSTEGLFRFNLGAAGEDLGFDRAELQCAQSELVECRRPFMFDDQAGIVLDLSALKDNPIGRKNGEWNDKPRDKRITGAISKLKSLPPSPLLRQLYVLAGRHSPEFADAMREDFPDIEESPLEEHQAPSSPFMGHQAPRREESSSEERRRVVAL